MRVALDDLRLDHLWIIYPGTERYEVDRNITAWPLRDVPELQAAVDECGR